MKLIEQMFKVVLIGFLLLLLLGSGACLLFDVTVVLGSLAGGASRTSLNGGVTFLLMTGVAALLTYGSFVGIRALVRSLKGEESRGTSDDERKW